MKNQRVYVVSDWHLGGTQDGDVAKSIGGYGTQICRSERAIVEFIDWIVSRAADQSEKIELIINGDMVDFLAPEPDWQPCEWVADESKAAARLEMIVTNSRLNGRSPFDALHDLLSKEHTLTLLLGNHDVELSLPLVRKKLVELLGADGRKFNFIYDGEACVRGQLLIEHGNRYDSFNALDYSALRQERSHLSRGLPVDEKQRKEKFFLPPAGTILVVQGINDLLATHPYLNLLKPETKAAFPLLIALRPDIEPILNFVIKAWEIRKRKGAASMANSATPVGAGYLSSAVASTESYSSLEELLKEMLTQEEFNCITQSQPAGGGQMSAGSSSMSLLQRVQAKFDAARSSLQNAAQLSQLVLASDTDRRRILVRAAFRKLHKDISFTLDRELPNYLDAASELLRSGQFSHVVFGHTHLPKKVTIERDGQPPGLYMNCGTWANVIALPDGLGQDSGDIALKQFVDDLSARNLNPHLRRYLTYIAATFNSEGAVSASLHSYCGPGAEQEQPLKQYPR